jgi:hypothetical protein
VVAADFRSATQVRHGGLVASIFAAIPMCGAVLRWWQADLVQVSTFVAFSAWFRGAGRRRSLVLVDPVEDVCVIGLVCRGLFKKGYVLYPQMIYKSFFDSNKKEMEGVHFLILVLHVHNSWQEGYRDF